MAREKQKKTEINIGDQVYGVPSDGTNPFVGPAASAFGIHDNNGTKKPVMGMVTGYDEVSKKYCIEWSAGSESVESYESETFVRAAKFSMKVIADAMGLNLPKEN